VQRSTLGIAVRVLDDCDCFCSRGRSTQSVERRVVRRRVRCDWVQQLVPCLGVKLMGADMTEML
jgi:hypothetical protein